MCDTEEGGLLKEDFVDYCLVNDIPVEIVTKKRGRHDYLFILDLFHSSTKEVAEIFSTMQDKILNIAPHVDVTIVVEFEDDLMYYTMKDPEAEQLFSIEAVKEHWLNPHWVRRK